MISGIYTVLFSEAIRAPDRLHLNQTENMAHRQMRGSYCHFKSEIPSPGRVSRLVGASSPTPKGSLFDSLSVHISRL